MPPEVHAGLRMPSMLLAPVIQTGDRVEVPSNQASDQPPVREVH